jgi:hypothetical protein
MPQVSASNARDPNRLSVEFSDWHAVVRAFHDLFDGLGQIVQDEAGISFASSPPDVATGLTLCRDGRLAASMPLHGMQATVHRIRWDESRTWVELVGDGLSYTYRIPGDLLRHRAALSHARGG